jgi:hypothetical protein
LTDRLDHVTEPWGPSLRWPKRAWDPSFRLRLTHMDWLTFSDHVIGHIAWPLAVSGIIVFLSLRHRAAINDLLYRVQKAKAGLFEIEPAEAKVRAELADLPPAPAIPPRTQDVKQPTTNDPTAWLTYLRGHSGTRLC